MELLDRLNLSVAPPPPPARRPRTPAQAEASRRNGGKSPGPRTPAGKARSRANAWRSGLFAKTLRPCDPHGYEHHDFDEPLRHLAAEHRPAGQTEHLMVEVLAADMLHLRRVLELRRDAFAVDPGGGPRQPGASWCVEAMEDELALLGRLVDACERGARLRLPPADVAGTAAHLVDLATRLAEVAADPASRDAGGPAASGGNAVGVSDPHEELVRGLIEEQRALHDRVEPAALGLLDEGRVADVLGGRRRIPEGEGPRWLAFLRHVRADWADRIEEQREDNRRHDRHGQMGRRRLLKELPDLASILKFERQVRQDVERTTRQLLALRAARAGGPPGFVPPGV